MNSLPKLIVSSVVRGSQQGDSHGGLYIVDIQGSSFHQVLDWNACDINWEGRGADRGLRGIAFHDNQVYVAASDELFLFSRNFSIEASFRNTYLKHCHEIWKFGPHLYLTSTGFDSILRFDLTTRKFDSGIYILPQGSGFAARIFDPNQPSGPTPGIGFHFNNVYVDQRGIFMSGRKLGAMLKLNSAGITPVTQLPMGTHNARPFREGILFNDTEADALTYRSPSADISISIPRYPESDLLNTKMDESKLARQGFGRGLCPLNDTLVAGGSSPTTIALYDLEASKVVRKINITMDVRNATHGLAVWPY